MLSIATLSLLSALTVTPVYEASQPSPPPAVTTILPADTPLVGIINTKAAAWGALGRFQLFQTAFTAVSQLSPPDLKFDYTRDVESWLGDQVVLAFMPKVGSEAASLDSSFLMLAPVKDDRLLQPFVNKIKAGSQRLTERQYKGIAILEWKSEPAPPTPLIPPSLRKPNQSTSEDKAAIASMWKQEVLDSMPAPQEEAPQPSPAPNSPQPNQLRQRSLAFAMLPGYIATATSAKPIEQLIDASQDATLAESSQFQQTIQQSQAGQALFTLYENPAKFLPLLEDISKDPNLPFPVPFSNFTSLEQLNEYSTVNGFLLVQPEGLRFQINAYYKTLRPDRVSVLTTNAEEILTWLPAATYSAATGRQLHLQWQSLASTFNATPELKNILSTLRGFVRSSTGLDLDRDIIGWMNGEYAFFLFPTKGGLFSFVSPNFNLGIGLVLQTSDRSAADTTLKKLEQSVKSFSQGVVEIKTRNIKGEPVTSWDLSGNSSQSLFAYSWVDNDTIVITTGFGAIADLVPQPYTLLPKAYTFTTATQSLPRPNQGYFYMNMGSFLSWAYGFVPPTFNNQYFQTFKQIIGTIHSVSATSSTTAEREQLDALIVLAPTRASREK